MSDQPKEYPDEVGEAVGPQAAAKKVLDVEIDGHESDGGGAQESGEGDAQAGAGPSANTWNQVLPPLLKMAFGLAAIRWPKMAATEEELAAMNEVLVPVLEKHGGGAIPIEYVAAGTCAAIVLPKVLETWADSNRERAAREAEGSSGGAAQNAA